MKKIYKADLNELQKIAADVELFCEENNVDAGSTFALNLCLDEVFTNIVEYAYKGNNEKTVEIDFAIQTDNNGRSLKIVMRDTSAEFNPLTQVKEPDLDASIEDREIGGLGIFFLKKNMDKVEYCRKDGVNVLTMHRNLK